MSKSLEQMIIEEAEKRELDPDAAMKLHGYFASKAASRGPVSYPAIRDARFPNHNQAPHCWTRYNEWLLCLKAEGSQEPCADKAWLAKAICPITWFNNWEEQRAEGIFPGIEGAPVFEADDDE